MAEESAVKVCVRVRPLIERERASGVDENVQLYWRAEKQSIHQIEDVNSGKSFFFDRVFNSDETTNQLYQDFAKPLVVSTVEGYNGTIFAYGQTASGKTFTMMGSDIIPGVIPLAMKDVFQAIKNLPKKEFLLRVSYMEIYNETVTDLLCDSSKRKPLEIREGNHKNVYVGDLTEEVVTSPEQALGWIRKGEKNRHYGKTKMNQRSSRSHTIFRMILESRDRSDTESGESSDGAIIVSHLNLVDLAGSERASQTGAEGARFKEGCNINRSLFILGQVIKKLSDENQKGFTNYRDSKLTRILQNSLGGNAKTVIICTVTTAVIEETISTLQFASAAKKMKNDPHVTEVSDDGALLKRYRNEIEDLKRRLQEVSQVTQATATEKETLSQLLQERDQLQRDQEDRIKNLTNLLRPKRRVTWGGKLLKAAQSNFHDVGENFSFVEPLSKVKKVDLTVLQEDGEFDSHWEIPEETNFDRTDHSNVAMTSFSDSFPCSSESPSQIHSDKLSCLEMELESEALLKKEAMEKVEALERQLEESQKLTEDQEQTRKQFEETRQLCENLFSEKIVMAEERDYLKQELSISIEQMRNFEKENAALQQELQDKKDMEEFMSLEEECKKVQEMELQKDISSLKLVLETSELARKELEANLQSMSEELKRKNELAEELQSLNGKDLVQQVSQLRRSLDDAEMLSRDTKKDWAFLRSDNISLKEKAAVLTADHEKMENEVKGLRCQLETAKTRFIQMQKDLQTELQVTFDENTKLTILLDGKVPKNLIDGMALEKSVATLRKTVSASQEEAALLRAQNEELISLQHLPDQVDCLTKQVQDLTQELCEVKTQRDSLLSAERKLSEHMESQPTPQLESLRVDLEHASSENLRLLATVEDFTLRLKDSERVQAAGEQKLCEVQDLVKDLEEKLADSELSCSTVEKIGKELQEESDHLKEILEGLREEKNQLKTDVEEKMEMLVQIQAELQQQQQMNYKQQELLSRLGEERDQLKTDLAENVEMMIENQQELRDSLEKNCQQKEQILQLKNGATVELQNQINKLTEELESVRVERDRLLSEKTAGPQNSNEERDQLLSTVTSLTGERDQLLSTVTSLSEERDQLTEIVKGLRDERNQLKTDAEESTNSMQHMTVQMESLNVKARQLEDNVKKHVEMAAETEGLLHSIKEELQQQMQLNTNLESQHLEVEESLKQMSEELESVRVERDRLLSEKTAGPQNSTAERDQLLSTVTLLSKERDQLLSTVTSLSEERDQLLSTVTSPSEARDQLLFTVTSPSEARDQLLSTVTSLSEARDQLLSTVTSPSEERDQLLSTVTSLSEERDQLLSTVTSLTGERNELLSTVTSFSEERDQLLSTVTSLSEERDQLLSTVTSLSEERDQLLSTVTSLSEERDQLLSTVTSLSEERDQLLSTVTSLSEERDQLFSTVTSLTGERDELLSTVTSLTGERDELLSTVTSLTGERDELLSTVTSLSEERDQLLSTVTSLSEERDQLLSTVTSLTGERDQLLSTVTSLTGERDQLLSTVTSLTGERDQLLSTVTSLTGERDQLLSTVTSLTGERDQLLSTVTSLTGERDELNEILEGLRGRRDQLKAELEDKIETLVQIQVELQQQQKLNCEQRELLERLQRERDQLETKQQEYVERKPLKDELHDGEHSQHCAKGEVEALQQLLSDANVTISKLKQTNCGTEMAAEGLALRLQDSARQVQEILEKFMRCRETCSEVESAALYGVLPMASTLMKPLLRSLPKHLVKSHCSIGLHGSKTFRTLSDMKLTTKECALECKRLMEDTVRFDLAVFEERRLQDVLLCRAQAPSYSVAQDNLKMLWDQRLVHLLDKRPHYFQKMENVLNQMEANLACQSAAFSSEVKEMDLFNEQLRPLCSSQPLDLDALDALLRREFARRSDVNERQKMALEAIIGAKRAHASQVEELRVQAHGQLREERSRTSTLLQALERGPAKTELQLLKDNQQLLLQLEKCRRDYESVVKNLPKDAPPSAAELDKLRAKLVKMEVEMIAASSKHQEEMERMTVLLNHKENTLRKLRESLRRTQLGEEDTFSQGADLHAKLTATRGYTPQRSALEKKKMEEVQMLKMNITELKSLVSSQQAEMSKLKSRAKAKGKTVAKVEKLLSPCTPTKRHTLSAVENTEAPNPNKRFLDSPTVPLASPSAALLQSPKSNFFDIHSGCESMSMNCPKQFFDNTSLGTIPDANAGADVNEGLWPLSPKQADLCKQQ